MEPTLSAFKGQQEKAKAIQGRLLEFLSEGEAAGVSIDPALKQKLLKSIEGSEKLKVALVGGFSEGKTSIAAAWLGKLDKSTMHISHQESSDAVAVYEIDDALTLIDTPGLFGYKEKFNADIHEQEKYKEITKKYVSGAHLVLYVMNSTNPLKESHKDDLNWLFRDLCLLPRTIFVLSRFDEVSDISDEDDYQKNFAIKQENVSSRLRDLIGLNDDEKRALSIVAVSANPFDAGMEHWLSEPDRFKQLSHIAHLQDATTDKIKANGGLERLALETSKSVIQDILMREIPLAIDQDETLADEAGKLSKAVENAKSDANAASRRINDVQIALSDFVAGHFTDLILRLDGSSMETISEFFEREIGSGGIVLDTKIQNEFSKRVDSVSNDLVKIEASLDAEISAFDSHAVKLGRQGLNYVMKSNVINAGSIKATRDVLFTSFKFKPWGAVNLAKNMNAFLAFAGIALEAWDSWREAERRDAFQKSKLAMRQNLEGQRAELLAKIKASDFSEQFFPEFFTLEQRISALIGSLQQTEAQRTRFAQWRKNAEAIDAEFTVLKG